MSKVCLPRFYAAGDFKRLSDTQMRWMRFLPQRVNDQTFYTGNLLLDFIRDRAAIAQVSNQIAIAPREQISAHFGVAVGNGQGGNLRFPQKKWAANNVRFRF